MSREISLLLAGDALLTRPWSHVRDADFLGLIEEIRDADVAIANLETVIHEFKGHAQADFGGTYMASPPHIAAELKWAGFDMLAHANNHAFDYGASGILETFEHARCEGLIVAGSGPDLQRARAPRYLQCDGGRVALVAMAVDFVSYGKASFVATRSARPAGDQPSVTGKRTVIDGSAFPCGGECLGVLPANIGGTGVACPSGVGDRRLVGPQDLRHGPNGQSRLHLRGRRQRRHRRGVDLCAQAGEMARAICP